MARDLRAALRTLEMSATAAGLDVDLAEVAHTMAGFCLFHSWPVSSRDELKVQFLDKMEFRVRGRVYAVVGLADPLAATITVDGRYLVRDANTLINEAMAAPDFPPGRSGIPRRVVGGDIATAADWANFAADRAALLTAMQQELDRGPVGVQG